LRIEDALSFQTCFERYGSAGSRKAGSTVSSATWLNLKAQDVLDLLASDTILSFRTLPTFPVVVIEDFEDACMLAWTPYNWSSLIQAKEREVYRRLFERQDYDTLVKDAIALISECEAAFAKSFRFRRDSGSGAKYQKNKYFECVDDIISHLRLCYLSRILTMEDDFLERILEIYKGGCGPCGWEGEYPQGTFVVFKEESRQ